MIELKDSIIYEPHVWFDRRKKKKKKTKHKKKKKKKKKIIRIVRTGRNR